MIRAMTVALCLLATASCANVETSERPVARPEASAETEPRRGLWQSLRPFLRRGGATAGAQQHDALCGDNAIRGERVGRVLGEVSACGIDDAVRVRSVSGVALSTGALMDCQTAAALKTWIEDSAKPALRRRGGGLARIDVAAHYICRTRNHQEGARVSEHGKGRAIDISGFTLADGSQITVLEGWEKRRPGRALRRMHRQACGPFGTVLGPEADRFHRDHFHFDTARYRNGSYCR